MRRTSIAAATVLVLTGCSSGLTLRQQEVYDRFEQCRSAAPGVELTRVREDGHFTITGTPGGPMQAVQQCMREKFGIHFVSERRDLQRQASLAVSASAPAVSSTTPSVASATAPMVTTTNATAYPTRLRAGSEWAYRWHSERGKGTFVYVLDREEVLDGAAWYVLKGPTAEVYYRKDDLATSIDVVKGEVTLRRSPPLRAYRWPLTIGDEWEQTYVLERPKEKQSDEITAMCRTEREETVTVPAGSFHAVKSVCHHKSTGRLLIESWYAPEVGMFVRDISSLRGGGTRERELTQYRLR
jgi:hypothetical protein